MSPSKTKYREAMRAAKDFSYGKIKEMPLDFDERQERIFNEKLDYFNNQYNYFNSVNDDVYLFYTGKTANEYHKSLSTKKSQ